MRNRAEELRGENEEMIRKASVTVRSVLRVSGPRGAHVALLRDLLVRIGYKGAEDLVKDLVNGFQLIGGSKVVEGAKDELVRDYEKSAIEVS